VLNGAKLPNDLDRNTVRHQKYTVFSLLVPCISAALVLDFRPSRAVGADAAITRPQTQPAGPDVVKLTLHPSRVTRQSKRLRLLPDLIDQEPGNAATLYLLAASLKPDKFADRLEKPEQLPLDQCKKNPDADALLADCADTLRYVLMAVHRQEARWDTGIRDLGFEARLPYLHDLYDFTNLLQLQAKVQTARGDLPGALRTAQDILCMARQFAEDGWMINGLMAASVIQGTVDITLTTWIASNGSDNLYWALTRLPHPFIERRAIAQTEQATLYYSIPELRSAIDGRLTPEQWTGVLRQVIRFASYIKQPWKPATESEVDTRAAKLIQSALAPSRAYLLSAGFNQEQINAMPPVQAAGIYLFHQYRVTSDEQWKTWELPYPQAAVLARQASEELRRQQDDGVDNPFLRLFFDDVALTPAKIVWLTDRRIGTLRTIEALRDYAAGHDGRPPERLDQIVDLPVPIDPFTLKPFEYRADGQTAVLEALAPVGMNPSRGQRFELTFVK
jgi:hypothetical protein